MSHFERFFLIMAFIELFLAEWKMTTKRPDEATVYCCVAIFMLILAKF